MSKDPPRGDSSGGRVLALADVLQPSVNRRARRETLELFAQVLLHRLPFPGCPRRQLVANRFGDIADCDLHRHRQHDATTDSILQAVRPGHVAWAELLRRYQRHRQLGGRERRRVRYRVLRRLSQLIRTRRPTCSELLVGVHLANTEQRRARRSAFVEAIFKLFRPLAFDLEVARVHAHLVSSLGRGVTLGALDLIIGATAIRHGFPVMTTNAADFRRMPGCDVEGL